MPSDFRIIRTMCSGRVDPEVILWAFKQGADGVMITGCHPGDCHYLTGNYKTLKRVKLLKKVLEQFGINPERLELQWISASEGQKFKEVIEKFVEKIKKL